MVNDFIKILKSELVSTIKGLTATLPTVKLISKSTPKKKSLQSAPLAILDVSVSGDVDANLQITIAATLATALGDMMFGGKGAEKVKMSEDELDTTKDIFSNVLDSISTVLRGQKSIINLNFHINNIRYVKKTKDVSFDGFVKLFVYSMNIQNTTDDITFAIDQQLASALSSTMDVQSGSQTCEISDDMKNIELIKDVKLPIRVRVGSTKIPLKDVLGMDVGSVIELDQLAEDPLEILVGDKVIAYGKVVVVDGNFGVQICEIGSKKERIETLR